MELVIIKNYESLDDYMIRNKEFFSQPLVKGFFESDPSHMDLLEKAVIQKDESSQKLLDSLFREHFSLYRLVKYISTLSHFFSIDYDKRLRKHKNRYPTILDKPVNDSDKGEKMIDLLAYNQQKSIQLDMDLELIDTIENDELFLALQSLNPKERQILHLIIMENKKQVDIAQLFDETPQNVAATKKKAIKKIQKQLNIQKSSEEKLK